jgi:hypothetical protein
MIYNAILAAAIANRLGGDRERVVELFHDNALHAELAAYQGMSEFRFCDQTNDGYYFVASGSGYDVYFKDRGSVQYIYRFADIRSAAAYFFSVTEFTSRREGISEGERISNFSDAPLPEAPLSLLRTTFDVLEAIVMAFLGLVIAFLALLVLFGAPQAPNLLAVSFTAAVSAFCFYASDRARRHKSCFRGQ